VFPVMHVLSSAIEITCFVVFRDESVPVGDSHGKFVVEEEHMKSAC
jgi:hypothetical protein